MLLNLHKKKWTDGLTLRRFDTHSKTNEQTVQVRVKVSADFIIIVYGVELLVVYW